MHGDPTDRDKQEATQVFFFSDDPDLANIVSDPVAWSKAHPCNCEALCTCDARFKMLE